MYRERSPRSRRPETSRVGLEIHSSSEKKINAANSSLPIGNPTEERRREFRRESRRDLRTLLMHLAAVLPWNRGGTQARNQNLIRARVESALFSFSA